MVQIIQIKRKFTGAGVPANLAPGELAYNNTGDKLYVGGDLNTVKGLVGSERQLEVHATSPAQPVLGGAKTFSAGAAGTLKVTGGNVGEVLTLNNVDGTLVYTPVVSASQQFAGSAKGDDGSVQLTTALGGATVLPAAAPANSGWYVIYDVAGAVKPPNSGATVTGPFEIGDWLISNGATWTHLQYGGISSVTAADVGVVAPVTGGANVQAVLESLEAVDVTHTTDILALQTNDTAQDTLIANKITKPATVAAALNIAVYTDTTGGIAADGGETIASLNAKIAAKADAAAIADFVVGPAASVDNNVAVYSGVTGLLIKDGGTTVAALGDVKGQAAVIAAADNIAVYTGTNQKAIKDGGVAIAALALKTDLTALGDVKGPATAINSNLAAFDTTTGKLIKDSLLPMASVGDVKGPASVATTLNIAVYSGTTGKLLADGGVAVAALATTAAMTTADNLRALKAGDTFTGPVLLPAAMPVAAAEAAHKAYVDQEILAVSSGASVLVTGPELVGTGLAGAEITFTGITTAEHATGVAGPSFSGTGLSTAPLTLLCIDGGEYT